MLCKISLTEKDFQHQKQCIGLHPTNYQINTPVIVEEIAYEDPTAPNLLFRCSCQNKGEMNVRYTRFSSSGSRWTDIFQGSVYDQESLSK